MAKPIRSTPTLRGPKAVKFIKEMLKREKEGPNSFDKEMASNLKKNWKTWSNL
jgi:hypothetical protein